MIALFVVAGIAPALAALGIVFWARWIRNDPASDTIARGMAIGFAAGIALGLVVGVGLIGLALLLASTRAR